MNLHGATLTKGHGTGNDFVLVPDAAGGGELTAEQVVALCDRRTGIGADGVLRVAPSRVPGAAWFMDYWNADGSLSEMCGNGARVFARWLVDRGWAQPGTWAIDTRGGLREVTIGLEGPVTIDMGPPAAGAEHKVTVGEYSWPAQFLSMGNPHVVAAIDIPLADLDLTRPPTVEPLLPDGVNVELVVPGSGGADVAMRVHERGSGETQSCGTGACAVAVVHAMTAGRQPTAGQDVVTVVDVPGGRLTVTWTTQTVLLTGPAVLVADLTLVGA